MGGKWVDSKGGNYKQWWYNNIWSKFYQKEAKKDSRGGSSHLTMGTVSEDFTDKENNVFKALQMLDCN